MMGWLENYMKGNKAKDVLEPLVSDYSLAQCVELKDKIKTHLEKGANVFMSVAVLFWLLILVLAIITGLEDSNYRELALLIYALSIMPVCIWAGHSIVMNRLRRLCDERITQIAGEYDGEETQGQN